MRRKHRRSVALVALAVLALLVLFPRTARAALIRQVDLSSVVYESSHIVRAHQISEKKVSAYQTVRTMVVTKNYKGDLEPGKPFTVDHDLYSFSTMNEIWDGKSDGGPPADLDPEIIVFMGRPKPSSYAKPVSEFDVFDLRIFRGGKAQRFAQMSNPGGLHPTPQGLDPRDLCGDPRATMDVDLPFFERMLDGAQARVAAVKAAMAAPDTPEARRALARMVGREEDIGDDMSCYDDRIAYAIVTELAKREDVAALLDAIGRGHVLRYSWMKPGRNPELFRIAKNADGKWAIPARVAAIRVLVEDSAFGFDDVPDAEARTIALFDDPSPRIRAQAYTLKPSQKPGPAYAAALRKRWAAEKDERALISLAKSISYTDFNNVLNTPVASWPLYTAYVTNDNLLIPYIDIDRRVRLAVSALRITAKRDGVTRVVELEESSNLYGGEAQGTISAALDFRPPLEPGKWHATVDIELSDTEHHRKDITKTVDLGEIEAPPPLTLLAAARAAAPAPAAAPSSSVPIGPPRPEKTASVEAPVEEKRGACGCRVVGAASSPDDVTSSVTSSIGLAVAALVLSAWRRPARRSHRDRA